MRNTRTIIWLASGIGLIAAIHLALDIHGSGVSRMVGRSSIAESADAASAVSIKRSDSAAVVMSKASGEWRLVSPFRASADLHAVLGLLDALAFTPIVDSMDEAELRKMGRQRNDFGLVPPRVEVETLGPGGVQKIAFGGPTPAGDGIYAAIEGESIVFVVATNVFTAVDKSVDGFRSHALFTMGLDEVGGLDIRRTAGVFARFMRDGDKWWMREPKNVAASTARIRKFVSMLIEARAQKFVWPVGATNETETATASLLAGYGLDPDSATTLTLKGVDGVDRQVSFGNDAGEGNVYVLAHNGGAIVTVAASVRDAVLSGADDFVDTRLFPIDEASVVTVSISDEGLNCVIAKEPDGSWRIDAPVSAPADASAVSDLVSRLLTMDISSADASGVNVSLAVGTAPAKVPRKIVFADSGVERFRSKEMLALLPEQIKRIVVTKAGDKSVSVVYDAGRRSWNVETSDSGGIVDMEALEAMLAKLNPLTAQDVVKLSASASDLTKYGLETPSYTIALDRVQEDSVRRNIRIGAKSTSGYYATVGSSDSVFVLPEETVRTLVAPILR